MQPYQAPDATVGDQYTKIQMRKTNWLASLMAILFFVGLGIILISPLLSRSSWLVFVQDDLLYYIKVAQSLAHGHGSTFNGIVATNGYQPLWFLLLVAVSWVTVEPRLILAFLALSNLLAALATFLLSQKLLRDSGASPLLVFVFSAWTTLYAVTLFFYGMEVTLTVPVMLGVVCLLSKPAWLTRGWTHTFLFGLLLSAMVLSRIDTLIFGGLLLCGITTSETLRKLIRIDLVLGVLSGLLPVVLYFFINHAFFDTWLPVSGMAKELKRNHLPSAEPWRVFFHPLAAMFTTVIITALTMLWFNRDRIDPIRRVVFSTALIFPFTYYLILSCVSDWTLWGWYIYPIRTALCVSFVILLSWTPLLSILEKKSMRWALVASVFLCLALLRWTRQQNDIYEASIEIQHFARNHPGIYAMGDRAGRVAYLIQDPVVQTEGLMMDRNYLSYIDRETPLRETLAHYNVRYYVATAYEPYSGCFSAVEPAKAGPSSHKMRATFCEEPQARYVHDGIQTLIYDLGQQ